MLPAYLNGTRATDNVNTTEDEDAFISMFNDAAQDFLDSLDFRVASTFNRGKQVRFRPGQPLHPSADLFVREVIQPKVQDYIATCIDWSITIFTYINVIFIITILQLYQWIGTWNLLAYYLWPSEWETELRDGIYFSIGVFLIFLSMRFFSMDKSYEMMEDAWQNGIPTDFGWKRKFGAYARETFSFTGYLFVWVGAWDFVDTHFVTETVVRDGVYVLVPLVVIFVLEEILAPESIYYMATLCAPRAERTNDPRVVLNADDETLFEPGQHFTPASDWFIREMIQPLMRDYVSPCGDYVIRVFNYLNNIFLITIVSVFQWVGIWDLLAYYVWPWNNTQLRDGVYAGVGFFIMFLSLRFFNLDISFDDMEDSWSHGIPTSFGWYRKIVRYSRETFSFFGFLFVWVGVWDFIDAQMVPDSLARNCVYIAIPFVLGFVFGHLLSAESLYYLAVQQTDTEYDEYLEEEDQDVPTQDSSNDKIVLRVSPPEPTPAVTVTRAASVKPRIVSRSLVEPVPQRTTSQLIPGRSPSRALSNASWSPGRVRQLARSLSRSETIPRSPQSPSSRGAEQ